MVSPGGGGGGCKGFLSPHFYYNGKKNFLQHLWRLVFLVHFGETDGLPGGGGGLQGVGDCKGGSGYPK